MKPPPALVLVSGAFRQKGMNMSHSLLILCKTKTIKRRRAMDKGSISFEQVVERGCGLDVHKENVVATLQGKGIKTITKSYSTFTGSLEKQIGRASCRERM